MKETREIAKHIPVLMDEVLDGLDLGSGKSVVDATLGGGGHTRAILQKIAPTGKLLSLDQDASAIEAFLDRANEEVLTKEALQEKRLLIRKANFSEIEEVLAEEELVPVDAIMADLGYSSDQIEDGTRGLSFQNDGPLDMRLDQERELTAKDIIMTWSLEELTRIFRDYGEEEYGYQLARDIVRIRETTAIDTTRKLAELIEEATPAAKRRLEKIHPATKVFQALRIAVNEEYERLETFLERSLRVLKPGGRLAIISFHSGEDKRVKEFFQQQAKGCICPREFPICICGLTPTIRIITRKVITPTDEEVKENPRARSAKLRIAVKI
ncbi:MAG: 16S rRNA (cytosine(1402)-N(4))-methyltransferase RsmH [Patescibacteria group bacterium]